MIFEKKFILQIISWFLLIKISKIIVVILRKIKLMQLIKCHNLTLSVKKNYIKEKKNYEIVYLAKLDKN